MQQKTSNRFIRLKYSKNNFLGKIPDNFALDTLKRGIDFPSLAELKEILRNLDTESVEE